MRKLRYTHALIKTVSWKLYALNPYNPYALETFHSSLKHGFLLSTFNSFNSNTEISQTIYRTNILQTQIS